MTEAKAMHKAKDRVFVFGAFALGFLLFEFILFEGFGIGVTAFVAAFYGVVFWYLSGKPGGFERKGLWLLVPIGLLSACFALYDSMVLSALNFLLLYALVALQLTWMTGNRLYRTSLPGLAVDMVHAGVVLPFSDLPAPFRALRRDASGGKRGRLGSILIGLALSVPIVIIVLALLASADAVFERGLNGLFEFLGKNVAEYIWKVVLGAIAAIPLFGMVHALRENKAVRKMKLRILPEKARFLDEAVAGTVMALLSAVYLAFVGVQFGYLFNAFSSILPADFTYAEYARRGFFELMGVSVINMLVLASSMLFSKRAGDRAGALLKALETALVILTLLLLASAFAKMAMYMDAYGLTLLRVYVSWFMLLLAVFFVAILVKLHAPKFALTRFCGVAFLTLFLALSFADVDARIAQYNIEGYRSGKYKTVDVEMFYDLSDSMIPYAAQLLDDENAAVAGKAKELLESRARIVDDMRWQVFSLAHENARRTLIDHDIWYEPRTGSYDWDRD